MIALLFLAAYFIVFGTLFTHAKWREDRFAAKLRDFRKRQLETDLRRRVEAEARRERGDLS